MVKITQKIKDAITDYEAQIKFMESKGWLQEHWIKEYGTTENPLMGDGGERIWEADFEAYFRARKNFLDLYYKNHLWRLDDSHPFQKRIKKLLRCEAPEEIEKYIGIMKYGMGRY